MEGVRPLRKPATPPLRPSPAGAGESPKVGHGVQYDLDLPVPAPPSPSPAKRGKSREGATPATLPGIDKATLAKLTRGEIAIDARLDLHGMTQAEAHRALDRALDSAVRRGLRLLLVITGKGVGGDGILRRALPGWLEAGPHAARVLRAVPAQARHGGGGAWYVYLRRKR